jgi:hypothetical protein
VFFVGLICSVTSAGVVLIAVIIGIFVGKTTPAVVTLQIRPSKIPMITAIKTTPAVVTLQIRPTKILMITAIKTPPAFL